MLQSGSSCNNNRWVRPRHTKGCMKRTHPLTHHSRLRFGMEHIGVLNSPLPLQACPELSHVPGHPGALEKCLRHCVLQALVACEQVCTPAFTRNLQIGRPDAVPIMDKANSPTNATGNDFFMVVSLHLAQAHRLSRAHTVPQCRTHVQ